MYDGEHDRAATDFIERFYDEVFHRGNLEVLTEIFSEVYVTHGAGCGPGGERRSILQLRETVAGTRAAFPDLRLTVEKVFVSVGEGTADLCSCYRFEGTHREWLRGIAPTYRRVNVSGIDVYRISGGKIVEGWESFDSLAMLRQFGVIPVTQSAPTIRPDAYKPVPPVSRASHVSTTPHHEGWSSLAMLAAFVFGFSIGDD